MYMYSWNKGEGGLFHICIHVRCLYLPRKAHFFEIFSQYRYRGAGAAKVLSVVGDEIFAELLLWVVKFREKYEGDFRF
jgi:hypothetical protein